MLALVSVGPFPVPAPHAPYPRPGEPWTRVLAEDFLRRHDAAVTAAFLRLQEEMASVHPGGGLYLARYDARTLERANPLRTELDTQLAALVQVRAASGRIISATIVVE